MSERSYRLSGKDAPAALDWLHARADVLGVLEGEGEVLVRIAGPLPGIPFPDVSVEPLPDSGERVWTGLESDAPISVADDLIVRPPWVSAPEGFSGIELVIPRGGAFGSGEHDSTRAALRCMHRVWPESVGCFADVGTGSGILALYAVLRGAASVIACDTDPAAVLAARALLPGREVVLGGPSCLPRRADMVVANLSLEEWIGAADEILAAWTGAGPFVLAGIREREQARALAVLGAEPFAIAGSRRFRAFAFRGSRRCRSGSAHPAPSGPEGRSEEPSAGA
ncbi:MAG: hypothetical protein Fur0037_10480 [Planctomycetota bacterium]